MFHIYFFLILRKIPEQKRTEEITNDVIKENFLI